MSRDDFGPHESRRRDRRRDFQRRADAVRSISLESVLRQWPADRDRHDRSRWNTARGPLSITGTKFFSWRAQTGGGGAIDLVMHLGDMDARTAIVWLEGQFGSPSAVHSARPAGELSSPPGSSPAAAADRIDPPVARAQPDSSAACPSSRPASRPASRAPVHALRLPPPAASQRARVRAYLTEQRGLCPSLIDPLMETGNIYADRHGNAVFLMVAGKPQRPIGAELRGTGQQVWHGLAAGTLKDAGYFWVGAGVGAGVRGVGAGVRVGVGEASSRIDSSSRKIILCESAIDAISCWQLQAVQDQAARCICLSTAGVRSNPRWLEPLLARGYEIFCGFDTDLAGNTASSNMILRHPSIKRLSPPAHDWNDALRRP